MLQVCFTQGLNNLFKYNENHNMANKNNQWIPQVTNHKNIPLYYRVQQRLNDHYSKYFYSLWENYIQKLFPRELKSQNS